MNPSVRRPRLRIAFLHPDLGLGGAERLVVDAATSLQEAGHRVVMFTNQHDPERCFEETRDGTLDLRVLGSRLPRHVAQHLRAPCAILRMAYLTSRVVLQSNQYDVVFSDLVSHVLPLARLQQRAKLVFYCHFPDQLLMPRQRAWYNWYRAPIDRLEELGLRMADRVLVNSRYTADAFCRTFPRLGASAPEVLYPGVNMARYADLSAAPAATQDGTADEHTITILSLNRYEPKKNLALALDTLAVLRQRLARTIFKRLRLIIAGGYDERLQDNRETLHALQERTRQLDIERQVRFVCSCPEAERLDLLQRCLCLIYTPVGEHFGLAPVEAMAACRPVIAANSGGPQETIRHRHTGLLCAPTPEAFADALVRLIEAPHQAARMGRAGREHVARHFSRSVFGARLEALLHDLVR